MNLKTVKYVKIDDLKGVLYSAGKQSLLIPIDFIKSINAVFEKLVGDEGAQLLIYTMGESLGRGYVQSLEYILKEEGEQFGLETKIKSACNAIFMESGWGKINFISLDLEKKEGQVEISNSPSGKLLKSASFDLERGVLAGVFEEVIEKNVFCEIEKVEKGGKTVLSLSTKVPKELHKKEKMALMGRKELQRKIDNATGEIMVEKNKVTSIIDSMADGLITVDNDATITMINPRVEEYFDVSKSNVLGKKLNEVDLCDCLFDLYKKAKKGANEGSVRMEEPIVCHSRKDKDIFVQVNCKAVLSKESSVIGYLLVAHDVTREKRIERLKNEFISISAHQLRTPLAGIKWAVRMILDGEIGKIDKEATVYLDKAYQTNEIMICLVNDLLNVTRIEEGRFLLELKPVILKDLIKKVIMEAEVISERKDVNVELESSGDDVTKIKADAEKLRLALQNLVENSIKYSSPGDKITVRIKPEDKQSVIIEVEDEGIGIDMKEHKRVFSKFFRGRNASRIQTQGTGLGLFIVKNIIEAHKGKIWFESKVNEGTTFFIKLPIELKAKD